MESSLLGKEKLLLIFDFDYNEFFAFINGDAFRGTFQKIKSLSKRFAIDCMSMNHTGFLLVFTKDVPVVDSLLD